MDEAAAEVVVTEERVEEELHQSVLSLNKDSVYLQVLKSRCPQRLERRSVVEASKKRQ
jgi:hypothetical protein